MKRLRRTIHRSVVMGLLSYACGSGPAIGANQTIKVESRTITVRIDRPFDKAYEFLVDPANWNQWAFGLGKNIRHSEDGWIADSGGGVAKVQITPQNNFGIVDHTVIRPSGQRVYVPVRLIVNGVGCELIFTLFREPNISDAQFASELRSCGARSERVEDAARTISLRSLHAAMALLLLSLDTPCSICSQSTNERPA